MNSILETFLVAVVSGGFSGAVTVAVMRNDIKWIKEFVAKLETRVQFIERNI